MTFPRPASPRPLTAASLALLVAMSLVACSTADTSPSAEVSPGESMPPTPTPSPSPTPTPTPAPTPRYTNQPDTELAGLIPTEAAGVPIVVAPFDEFGLTPGDVAVAYGDIGNRFSSLVLAYVGQPRTSLYAMRVDGDPVDTADLEPYLATAGRYVGIAGLDPDPWEAAIVGGHDVWTRPEDNATALGTHIYTWSSGEFVFLLIGVDDSLDQAIVAALPGQAAPSPTPLPSESTAGSPSGSPGSSGG